MTAGIVQRYVAITPLHAARLNSATLIRYSICDGATWRSSRRWQSTVAKEMNGTEPVQPVFKPNEIPVDCFIDESATPSPSLSEVESATTVDLSTTRPAILNSPPSLEKRDYADGNIPLTDRVKNLYKLGRSYLSFYKTGLKNVWGNSKQYREIRKKLQGYPLNNVAKYSGQTIDGKTIPSISRSEYQLSVRTRHDLLKMIPFSLVFIICGEFTPLVIVALGSAVVPYTCRIPKQIQNDMEKKLRHDQHYMEYLPSLHGDPDTPLETANWQIEHLDAYRLGISSLRTPIPILGPLYHTLITRPKLIRHFDNLVADTLMIHREGGMRKLSHDDIYEWADSYGLYALRQYIEDCQKNKQEIKTEKLKTTLLPKIDAEIRYMLDQVNDWPRLKQSEQWRIGLRTVGSQSPDWQARVEEMRKHWKTA